MRFAFIMLCLVLSSNWGLPLAGQSLQDEALGHLLGDNIYPQDKVLGLMYVPDGASRATQEIFELIRSFWNQVNIGKLDTTLLSNDGKFQVREQVAPFTKDMPTLFREAQKIPSKQFSEIEQSNGSKTGHVKNLLPVKSLQLSLVRLANPVIDYDYARVRCRLGIDDNRAFLRANMYFIKKDQGWKIDALDVDWEDIQASGTEAIHVFGRNQELYRK